MKTKTKTRQLGLSHGSQENQDSTNYGKINKTKLHGGIFTQLEQDGKYKVVIGKWLWGEYENEEDALNDTNITWENIAKFNAVLREIDNEYINKNNNGNN